MRTKLWEGSDAAPVANSWVYLGNPAVAVTRGQPFQFAFQPSDATLTIGRIVLQAAGFATLPTAFDEYGLTPITAWSTAAQGSMGIGSTLPAITATNLSPAMFGIVT